MDCCSGKGSSKKHGEAHHEKSGEGGAAQANYMELLPALLIIVLMAVMAYNQLAISSANGAASAAFATMSAIKLSQGAAATSSSLQPRPLAASGLISADGSVNLQALEAQVFPTGVPDIYGKELGISFDDPVPAISVLAAYDDGGPMKDAQDNQRYVRIASQTACEYCCGAKSLVFNTGRAACGCKHSFAMRGLAKYLIKNHPQMSDEQILKELGNWKILYFPKQNMQKASEFVLAGKGINVIDLTSNKFRGFKSGQATGGSLGDYASQVGGC